MEKIMEVLAGYMEGLNTPKECKQRLSLAIDLCDELAAKLSDDDAKLLREYSDSLSYFHADEADWYFLEGFKLGMLMAIEIYK